MEKNIHYVRLGDKPMPETFASFIGKWKEIMGEEGYKFYEWNEKTFDVESNEWVKKAIQEKNYALAADVIRSWALLNYGGIYLDTDVELLKSLDDLASKYDFFIGYETNCWFGCAILGLWTVRADNGDVYYLVHTYVREMSNLGYAEIVPVKIQDSRLVSAPLFDASPDGYGNNCTFREYRFANWYFKTNAGEGWDWPYRYDLATRTLYVPEVIDEEMTDRYNLYTFNGEKFIYTGDDGGYWLHPSIREFKQLELLFCTKDYRIRVDMMDDGTYRYASWSKNVSMEDIPDIVICNGAYDEGSRTYSFENDGFQYNVVCEGDNQSKLVVIHDGEQMLQQGQIIEE